MSSSYRCHRSSNKHLLSRSLRRGSIILLLGFSVFLQGCFIERLISLRSQACSFDEHFAIRIDQNLEVELYDPVLLEKDLRLIWGAPPTSMSSSNEGSTLSYLFQRLPAESVNKQPGLLDEFNLDFKFVPVKGQNRLSEISSNELPAELLLTATTISLSGLEELTTFACEVDINPFTRSLVLPLDQGWFTEIPSRDALIAMLGSPNSTLDGDNGLVYQYSLKGSDPDKYTASFVIWYDEAGETPLIVEAGFDRYQMHTDLLTAVMKVQIEI